MNVSDKLYRKTEEEICSNTQVEDIKKESVGHRQRQMEREKKRHLGNMTCLGHQSHKPDLCLV